MAATTLSMTAAQFMARARAMTNVAIIDDDIAEALDHLLPSLNQEAQLSVVGAVAMEARVLRHLCNRLRMMRDYRNHPEIAEQRIERPLILTGGARTGSTKLHKLLASSGDFKFIPFWQAHNPSLRSGKRNEDPRSRIADAQEFVTWFDRQAPGARAVHAYDVLEAEEETHIYEMGQFGFYVFAAAYVPSFMEWFLRCEFSSQVKYFIKVIKYLQWQFHEGDPRPWIFKYPAYQSYEPVLRKTFPDAVLVSTHREAVSTLVSSASFFANFHQAYSDTVRVREIGTMLIAAQTERQRMLIDARKEYRDLGVLDISYTDLVHSCDVVVRNIYNHGNYTFSTKSLLNMKKWVTDNAQHRYGLHQYSADEFGIDKDLARVSGNPYADSFGRYF